jgi:hypothetical protein
MVLTYMYVERNGNYCFLKFASTTGTLTMEDVYFSSPQPEGGKKHPKSVIKVMGGKIVLTGMWFEDLEMLRGSVIELEGGLLTVDGCKFTNINSGGGEGSSIHAVIMCCDVMCCDVM